MGETQEWEEYRLRINQLFSAEDVPANVTPKASNTLTLIGPVAAGLGVTVYPDSLTSFPGRKV